ncbi:MAG: hypothetical protein WCC06_10100 [Candidatus Aminicenantales bacterium]
MKDEEILSSWKEIADYLNKEPRTLARWEKKLGLPIRRFDQGSSRSKVFAYKAELDDWLQERAHLKQTRKKKFWENKKLSIGMVFIATSMLLFFSILLVTHKISFLSSAKVPSLIIIPFKNLGATEHEEYFSEGITNELTNNLTRQSELRVIPAVSSYREKNAPINTKQIRDKWGADYILQGIVKKVEEKIYLTVQLIRAKDNSSLWKADYEEPMENLFSLQDNICLKIHEMLKLKIPEDYSSTLYYGNARSSRAFDDYLKGSFLSSRISRGQDDPWQLYNRGNFYSGRLTAEANELAISFFSQAIDLDDRFALAYIGLANCYANNINFSWNFHETWLNKAVELLQKAQSISPDLPEYYSCLIKIYILKEVCFSEKTDQMVASLVEKGLKKHSNHPQLNSIVGYHYYQKYGQEGKDEDFAKALEYKDKSFWANPFDLNNIIFVYLLILNREFDRAIQVCQIFEKADSTLTTKFLMGELYYYLGDLEQSQAIFQQFNVPLEFRVCALFYLGMISAQRKNQEETEAVIQEIQRISPGEFRFFETDLKWASIYFGLGDREQGYRYLKSFFTKDTSQKEKFIFHRYIDLDRNFYPYKEEEAFKKIIK